MAFSELRGSNMQRLDIVEVLNANGCAHGSVPRATVDVLALTEAKSMMYLNGGSTNNLETDALPASRFRSKSEPAPKGAIVYCITLKCNDQEWRCYKRYSTLRKFRNQLSDLVFSQPCHGSALMDEIASLLEFNFPAKKIFNSRSPKVVQFRETMFKYFLQEILDLHLFCNVSRQSSSTGSTGCIVTNFIRSFLEFPPDLEARVNESARQSNFHGVEISRGMSRKTSVYNSSDIVRQRGSLSEYSKPSLYSLK